MLIEGKKKRGKRKKTQGEKPNVLRLQSDAKRRAHGKKNKKKKRKRSFKDKLDCVKKAAGHLKQIVPGKEKV